MQLQARIIGRRHNNSAMLVSNVNKYEANLMESTKMYISQNVFRAMGRTALAAAIATVPTFALNAQQNDSAEGPQSIFHVQPLSTTSLIAANDAPASLGYSTSAGASETDAAVNFMAATGASPAMQPPPRRYGRRPIYADSSHNADGSNKYTFFGGAGFTLPTGGTHAYFSPSYNFQVGAGRNFNKKLALLLQFDWANFGLPDRLTNALADPTTGTYGQLGVTDVNGHAHIWSFTIDPQYTFLGGEKMGAYVIGGVGFYHKVTDFTTPETVQYIDPYYGLIQYEAEETFDSYVSNSVGFNGGLGITYKASRFSDVKFYAEARYVYTENQAKPFYVDTTGANNPTSNPTYFNAFPQNSAKTSFIPVTFGIRF